MVDVADSSAPRLTLARFLDWDDGTGTRYDLVDGVARAMTAASSSPTTAASPA